ncbi:MATE family efflux transporter [Desulfotalea psychrophila]|uniref:Multidrug-efflux transporter n=1 Tax=Desulfotalea psychrophila (strain LSv54 / DSM 12343) TaxID=177439 RepID=Q6ANQ1_DESPS|nr:MATE family efflux transporter [Desulfotalea psychrophila]CAG36023.1 related to transport protein [Desulfotalea psychrophila LSv54]
MEFTDRVFLSRYSLDAIAAATPAAMANLVVLLFFIGIVSYTNVFIAQYSGAGKNERVGAVLWQSIWLSIFAAGVLASLWFIAPPLFSLVGHGQAVEELQITYFRILSLGSGSAILSSALSCFFSGRGLTRPIMIVNTVAVLINIPLDYALIFGIGPFPQLGIAGAGIATISAWTMQMFMFAYLVFTRKNDASFAVWRARSFKPALFKQMMTYGLPAGVNMFFELFTFTFFIFMVGKIGKVELAASNIVFAINSIFFIPLMGLGIAVSTLVGQAIGRGQKEDAIQVTTSCLHIALVWTASLCLLFLFIPETFINIFEPADGGADFVAIKEMGKVLLRFVVIYCAFDTLYIVYSGAVKGAGDTRFIMWAIGILGIFVLGLPLYLAVTVFSAGIWSAWLLISLYIASLGMLALWRYYRGAWQRMTVVKEENTELIDR